MDIAGTLQAGAAAHQAGNLAHAEKLYRDVLNAAPQDFNALHLLGVVYLQLNRAGEAVGFLQRAVAQNPSISVVQFNLGLALAADNRPADALKAFDAVVAADPKAADAWEARGNALAQLGRIPEAVDAWKKAALLNPRAVASLANVGHALSEMNRHDEALDYLQRALEIDPVSSNALRDITACLGVLNRFGDMLPIADRAIARTPSNPDLHCARGLALNALGRTSEGQASLERALQLAPDHVPVLFEVLQARRYACDWRMPDVDLARLLGAIDRGAGVEPLTGFILLTDPAAQQKNARSFMAQRYGKGPAPVWQGRRYTNAKIRVAYVTADFRQHPVASLIVELLERHDRTAFDIYGLSYGPDDGGPLRRRVTAALGGLHDMRRHSDQDVATWLAANEIDIAVDLTGHCEYGRPGIFAWRGTPVQAIYLGFTGAMGAFYDYVIADTVALPPEDAPFYDEKIAYLPDCYQPADSKRPLAGPALTRAQADLPETGFVFCCFNQAFKITAEIFNVWMRILQRVEGSVLWLRCDRDHVKANLQGQARARGIDPARIVFASRTSEELHFARHALADLFLDTIDYNAHTTANEALWAGLPVITHPRRTFVGRVGASMLRAAGLPDLVADSLQDYEALAVGLAGDPQRLAAVRARVAAARTESAFFDADRFRRGIEAAYRTMATTARAGAPARTFVATP